MSRPKFGRVLFFAIGSVLICPSAIVAQTAATTTTIPGLFDRAAGTRYQSRSVVMAKRAMACTSDPRATYAAIQILEKGGSAIDAAIAANAVLGVAEPMNCGIGGDLFALVWDPQTQQVEGLNASGRAPQNMTREHLRQKGLQSVPGSGPLSWTVR